MTWLNAPWISGTLASILAVGAVYFFARGIGLLGKGLRNPGVPEQSEWVIRGIRRGILGLGLGVFACGLAFSSKWLMIFGAVFLGEEIFETGIMLLAVRAGSKNDRAT